MMRITNLADYAVLLLTQMARVPNHLYSAAELAKLSSIPLPTVSKILGALSRKGVLESKRGAQGGFLLADLPEKISIADIVEAVDGPIALTSCTDNGENCCDLQDICIARPQWAIINDAVYEALKKVRLDQVARQPSVQEFENTLLAMSSGEQRQH